MLLIGLFRSRSLSLVLMNTNVFLLTLMALGVVFLSLCKMEEREMSLRDFYDRNCSIFTISTTVFKFLNQQAAHIRFSG